MKNIHEENIQWHAIDLNQVVDNLVSSLKGLNTNEAKKRLLKYGQNQIKHQNILDNLRPLFVPFFGCCFSRT